MLEGDEVFAARGAARDALAGLFLERLVGDLLDISLSMLGSEVPAERGEYADFAPWYARADGAFYGSAERADFVERCRQRVRREMGAAPEDAEELMEGILGPSQPPCMHRYLRCQDIKLASIGALKWRGDLPPDDGSKHEWESFWDEAKAALRAWLDGALAEGQLARGLHQTLGEPTERRKAIVREFLLKRPPSAASWEWLEERPQRDGTTARAVLGLPSD
jgi:hypothetical protein